MTTTTDVQARGAAALAELVQIGQERGLPPIAWTLSAGGYLTGQPAPGPDANTRHAVEEWAHHLNTAVCWTPRNGVTRGIAETRVGEQHVTLLGSLYGTGV